MGAVLYHLLVGHPPHMPPGKTWSVRALLRKVQEAPPTSVLKLSPQTRAELVSICEQAMARRQEDRYADMGAMAAELQAYLENSDSTRCSISAGPD